MKNAYVHTYIHAYIHEHIDKERKRACNFNRFLRNQWKNVFPNFSVFTKLIWCWEFHTIHNKLIEMFRWWFNFSALWLI